MRVLKRVRQAAEKVVPSLVGVVLSTREKGRRFASPRLRTPFGFTIAGNRSMATGAFEACGTAFMQGVLSEDTVFIDVGANIGYYSCLARSLGSTVLSVEPLADNLEMLYANLMANGYSDVEVHRVALAEKKGELTLFGGSTSASLVPDWQGNSTAWSRSVPVSTLDTLIGNRFQGKQLVIKIDVEGAEYGVLRGASETLQREPAPIWHVEICPDEYHPGGKAVHFRDVFSLFWDLGYSSFVYGRGRLWPIPDLSKTDKAGIDFIFKK